VPNPSTTDLVLIRDIAENVVILKDGSLRAIVDIGAINFELRSSDEQQAILQQFESFLNSVDFPLQVVIQSRRFDIAGYVKSVTESAATLTNELLKAQAAEYTRFVQELSELANIMAKRFLVVIPFVAPAAEKTEGGGMMSGITGIFGKKKATAAPTGVEPATLGLWQQQLQQRADLVIGGLSGMGLKGRVLSGEELLTIYRELYNPVVPPEQQKTT
jgi:hypothetical protein